MKLGIVYHMPFWRAADGTLREVEGSFARYVDSLAPYFDEISLCVPVLDAPRGEARRSEPRTSRLAPLPNFEGPVHFYPKMRRRPAASCRAGFARSMCCTAACRRPAAMFAFALARVQDQPAWILIVGDLRALLPTMPYRGVKRMLWRAYTAFEECNVQWMSDRSLAFANGGALAAKHSRRGHAVNETTTTTISAADIASRDDACQQPVDSRADREPHRSAQRTARPAGRGAAAARARHQRHPRHRRTRRRRARARRSAPRSIADARVRGVDRSRAVLGPCRSISCCRCIATTTSSCCRRCPAKAFRACYSRRWPAGVPVVTTRVAGIPSLIQHERNGLLVDAPSRGKRSPTRLSALITDAALRARLIAIGYRHGARLHARSAGGRMLPRSARGCRSRCRQPATAVAIEAARICFVLPSLNGGGAERAAVHILNELAPASQWDRSMFLFSRDRAVSR